MSAQVAGAMIVMEKLGRSSQRQNVNLAGQSRRLGIGLEFGRENRSGVLCRGSHQHRSTEAVKMESPQG